MQQPAHTNHGKMAHSATDGTSRVVHKGENMETRTIHFRDVPEVVALVAAAANLDSNDPRSFLRLQEALEPFRHPVRDEDDEETDHVS